MENQAKYPTSIRSGDLGLVAAVQRSREEEYVAGEKAAREGRTAVAAEGSAETELMATLVRRLATP